MIGLEQVYKARPTLNRRAYAAKPLRGYEEISGLKYIAQRRGRGAISAPS